MRNGEALQGKIDTCRLCCLIASPIVDQGNCCAKITSVLSLPFRIDGVESFQVQPLELFPVKKG